MVDSDESSVLLLAFESEKFDNSEDEALAEEGSNVFEYLFILQGFEEEGNVLLCALALLFLNYLDYLIALFTLLRQLVCWNLIGLILRAL